MRLPCVLAFPLLVALAAPALGAPKGRTVEMAVTADGFVPDEVKVKKGETVTLLVTRKVERTCATEIVIKELGVNAELPLGKPVAVTITPREAGKLRYACGMDMIAGTLVVE
jgi:plastocyanin domain-containing protein